MKVKLLFILEVLKNPLISVECVIRVCIIPYTSNLIHYRPPLVDHCSLLKKYTVWKNHLKSNPEFLLKSKFYLPHLISCVGIVFYFFNTASHSKRNNILISNLSISAMCWLYSIVFNGILHNIWFCFAKTRDLRENSSV